ncbi:MAPEG family protein [Sandaracinobacter sp.]|uniref:MAPEG family protein n=1 Tax=Sandaracinobacter sp. TaxID=2487581 RepID=UPI0035B4389A
MQLTMITAGMLGLMIVVLGLRVSAIRRSAHVSLGDGGNPLLEERIRAHGNAVETIPIALILLGLAERALGQPWYLVAMAVVLVVSRLIHPIGMARPSPNAARVLGILGTWSVIGILALILISSGIRLCRACLLGA